MCSVRDIVKIRTSGVSTFNYEKLVYSINEGTTRLDTIFSSCLERRFLSSQATHCDVFAPNSTMVRAAVDLCTFLLAEWHVTGKESPVDESWAPLGAAWRKCTFRSTPAVEWEAAR